MVPAAARLGRSPPSAGTSKGLQYLLQAKFLQQDGGKESFGNVYKKYRLGLNRKDSFFETFLIS